MYKLRKQYRLLCCDYSSPGDYFVTICTKNREMFFGNVVNGKMELSEAGKIAREMWLNIPKQFPNIKLGVFEIMPDHVHGIISIIGVDPPGLDSIGRNLINQIPTSKEIWKSRIKYNPMEMSSVSLGKIIRWYKGRVKFEIGKSYPKLNFAWQSRYHDRVIRNDVEYDAIRQYIIDNPKNWEKDRNKNLFL
ncbi:MAG: transposase [Parcubacteria group bacterium]